MKKIALFALLGLSFFVNVFAQKVTLDKVDDSYVLSTEEIICRSFTDRMVLSVSLSAIKSGDTITYMINNRVGTLSPSKLPADATILYKTLDDEVLKFKSISSSKHSSTETHYLGSGEKEYSVHTYKVGNSYRTKISTNELNTQTIVSSFLISEEELLKLISGVKKIRIELYPDNYEKEFKKDKIGKALKSQYESIKSYKIKTADDF